MAEQKAVKTPITADELRDGLACAWMNLFGEPPSHASLAVLLAQSALETNYWHSCMNYNIGNAKASAGGDHDWMYTTTWEQLPADEVTRLVNASTPDAPVRELTPTKVIISPKHPMCCFHAFADLDDGCKYYLDLLHRRFSKSWQAVLDGNIEQFVTALKAQGYFTADLKAYLDGACRCYGTICLPWIGGGTIKEFQAAHALRADGDCGPETVACMAAYVHMLDEPADTIS